jgi:hypothetical protein
VRGCDMTAHLLDKTWDMQWKVVGRKRNASATFGSAGDMQAVRGRASITFSKSGMDCGIEGRLSSCSMWTTVSWLVFCVLAGLRELVLLSMIVLHAG